LERKTGEREKISGRAAILKNQPCAAGDSEGKRGVKRTERLWQRKNQNGGYRKTKQVKKGGTVGRKRGNPADGKRRSTLRGKGGARPSEDGACTGTRAQV